MAELIALADAHRQTGDGWRDRDNIAGGHHDQLHPCSRSCHEVLRRLTTLAVFITPAASIIAAVV